MVKSKYIRKDQPASQPANKIHYNPYGEHGGVRQKKDGELKTLIMTIPQDWQEYDTLGNWKFIGKNLLIIFVTNFNNVNYEFLVAIHEYIEAILCRQRHIREKDVMKFDIMFEQERLEGKWKNEEPGFDKRAPYYKEHLFATKIEKLMCKELGILWKKYDDYMNWWCDNKM